MAAFADMARHGVAQKTIDRLLGHRQKRFDSKEQWPTHLEALDITGAEAIKRSSEAALWGHVADNCRIANIAMLVRRCRSIHYR